MSQVTHPGYISATSSATDSNPETIESGDWQQITRRVANFATLIDASKYTNYSAAQSVLSSAVSASPATSPVSGTPSPEHQSIPIQNPTGTSGKTHPAQADQHSGEDFLYRDLKVNEASILTMDPKMLVKMVMDNRKVGKPSIPLKLIPAVMQRYCDPKLGNILEIEKVYHDALKHYINEVWNTQSEEAIKLHAGMMRLYIRRFKENQQTLNLLSRQIAGISGLFRHLSTYNAHLKYWNAIRKYELTIKWFHEKPFTPENFKDGNTYKYYLLALLHSKGQETFLQEFDKIKKMHICMLTDRVCREALKRYYILSQADQARELINNWPGKISAHSYACMIHGTSLHNLRESCNLLQKAISSTRSFWKAFNVSQHEKLTLVHINRQYKIVKEGKAPSYHAFPEYCLLVMLWHLYSNVLPQVLASCPESQVEMEIQLGEGNYSRLRDNIKDWLNIAFGWQTETLKILSNRFANSVLIRGPLENLLSKNAQMRLRLGTPLSSSP